MSVNQTRTEQEEENLEQSSTEPADTPESGPEADTAEMKEGDVAPEYIDVDIEAMEQLIEQQKAEIEKSRDQVLRIQAELENMRKRTVRDIEHAHKFALEKFVNELIPVLDSMELGIQASGTAGDIDSVREGMDLTMQKFVSTLEKFGVTVVDPNGEKFDPEKHEAVTMQAQEGAAAGTIISVLQKGYALNGRLVRPAMVIVAS